MTDHDVSHESIESKKIIQDVGKIESCELLETEPKTQCTA